MIVHTDSIQKCEALRKWFVLLQVLIDREETRARVWVADSAYYNTLLSLSFQGQIGHSCTHRQHTEVQGTTYMARASSGTDID